MEGTRGGSRFFFDRFVDLRRGFFSSTTAVECPPLACHFVIDRQYVYRAKSDVFLSRPWEVMTALRASPDLFSRTEETERFEWLLRDTRVMHALQSLVEEPSFSAIGAFRASDPRLPPFSIFSKISPQRDVLALHRHGDKEPVDADINADVDRLLELQKLLSDAALPSNLPRAEPPGAAAVWGRRAARTLLVTLLALAVVLVAIVLLIRSQT